MPTVANDLYTVNTIQYGSGEPGATGPVGATGPAGQDGASGTQGASGIGNTGATGPQGDQGASGADGATGPSGGPTGATGPQGDVGASGADSTVPGATGPQGDVGATGSPGTDGATGSQGVQGASGAAGATGPQGVQGASGVGATGISGASGAAGATGSGVAPIETFTTTSTDQVVVETVDSSTIRSIKYEMQISSSSKYQATELRLLVDLPNVYLTQYGAIGEALGTFESFYSPVTNNYSSPNINIGGISVWNGTALRVYTTNASVQLALLAIPVGTSITLTDSMSNVISAVLSTPFVETSSGIYDAVTVSSRSPAFLISNISWTGSGNIDLRFTPTYASTTLKYIKTEIPV